MRYIIVIIKIHFKIIKIFISEIPKAVQVQGIEGEDGDDEYEDDDNEERYESRSGK